MYSPALIYAPVRALRKLCLFLCSHCSLLPVFIVPLLVLLPPSCLSNFRTSELSQPQIYPPQGSGAVYYHCYLACKFCPLLKRSPFNDFGLWILLGMNVYLIWYYLRVPSSIDTIILLFYIQSVLIGVFNVLDMLTLKNIYVEPGKSSEMFAKKGCSAGFFTVHYGMFHLVYLFFLPSLISIKNIDFPFVYLSLWILLATCTVGFVQNKIRNRTEAVNLGVMFFMPYPRVIPIHLMILAPKFLNVSAPLVFLILKTIPDVVMHMVAQRAIFKAPAATGKSS